jgi:hypothetical protein
LKSEDVVSELAVSSACRRTVEEGDGTIEATAALLLVL